MIHLVMFPLFSLPYGPLGIWSSIFLYDFIDYAKKILILMMVIWQPSYDTAYKCICHSLLLFLGVYPVILLWVMVWLLIRYILRYCIATSTGFYYFGWWYSSHNSLKYLGQHVHGIYPIYGGLSFDQTNSDMAWPWDPKGLVYQHAQHALWIWHGHFVFYELTQILYASM